MSMRPLLPDPWSRRPLAPPFRRQTSICACERNVWNRFQPARNDAHREQARTRSTLWEIRLDIARLGYLRSLCAPSLETKRMTSA